MGHECEKKEKHQKKNPSQKVWAPKKDIPQACKENETTKEGEDQIVGDDKRNCEHTEEDLATWKIVKSTFKGKELTYEYKREPIINYTNGFDVFRIGKCSIGSETVT